MATQPFSLNFGSTDPLAGLGTDIDPLGLISQANPLQTNTNQGGWDFKLPSSTLGTGGSNPPANNWKLDWFGGKAADGTQTNGYLPVGLNALAGLTGAYLGFQQLNLAKDQLDQNKRIFNLNFENQARTVNTQLEDRQRARVASNPEGYESVDSYMKRNSVSTRGL